MDARVRLAVILSADEALRDLGTFAFFVSHLFSACGRHSSSVADLFRLIEMMEKILTEVQGVISYHHLDTTLLFELLRQWRQYLNRCVAASAYEVVEALGASAPFSLEPIMVDLEEGCYICPILPASMTDLIRTAGRSAPKSSGGGGNSDGGSDDSGSSGNKKPLTNVAATGGSSRVKVRYDAHLLSLFLQDGENLRSIMAGVPPP